MSAVMEAREPSAKYLAPVQQALVQQFELLATAPGGVKRLRELILTLAVQGRLVTQNPCDEPASDLVRRIRADKARLISSGTLRPDKPYAAITDAEQPFNLPPGWTFVRFGDASINRDGERIPVASSERDGRAKIYDYYGASGVIDKIDGYLFEKTLLLIGEDGANLLNRSTPIAFLAHGKFWVNNHAHVIDTTEPGLMRYLELFVNAISLEPYVTGTAQPKMNQAKLNGIVIALPPLAEQARIVARVEELMRLCDALEAQGQLEAAQHAQLVRTLLGTLTDSANADELAANWQRVATHFDTLLDRPEAIDALEQTILQLAVRGLLVPQDPNEEPASALLQKILAEKDRLIAEGKLKREDSLPTISDEEKPFELRSGWDWVRLADLMPKFQNGASSRGDAGGKSVTVLRLADIKSRRISLAETRQVPIKHSDIEKYQLEEGDILITRVNGSADIVGQFNLCDRPVTAIYCDHFIRMRIDRRWITPEFCALLGESELVRKRISSLFITTAGQKTVNQGHIGSLLFALPPISEQSRIVARVEELRRLCADLRQRLAASQIAQSHLAETLVESTTA